MIRPVRHVFFAVAHGFCLQPERFNFFSGLRQIFCHLRYQFCKGDKGGVAGLDPQMHRGEIEKGAVFDHMQLGHMAALDAELGNCHGEGHGRAVAKSGYEVIAVAVAHPCQGIERVLMIGPAHGDDQYADSLVVEIIKGGVRIIGLFFRGLAGREGGHHFSLAMRAQGSM